MRKMNTYFRFTDLVDAVTVFNSLTGDEILGALLGFTPSSVEFKLRESIEELSGAIPYLPLFFVVFKMDPSTEDDLEPLLV